jgi:dihydroorotate dehydrogenase
MSVTSLLVDRLHADRVGLAALRLLPPERAHAVALALLRRVPPPGRPPTPALARSVAGLAFANPLGVAAGFDKNGEVFDALLAWGFAAVEIGTVTPRPQPGNPKPRLFRLPREGAVINRLGFNNQGHAAVARRLARRDPARGVVGVNIGCNKDAADPVADFVAGVDVFAPLADYLTVNVSSPNTPGLRDWQAGERLARLLDAVLAARARGPAVPLFLKLAPDLDDGALATVLAAVAARPIDGVVYANTTTTRPTVLHGRHAGEPGGLSGRPLAASSTARLARIRAALGPERTLVGVGGVATAADVRAKLAAGADLVQLYTALVYDGVGLARRLLRGLAGADLPEHTRDGGALQATTSPAKSG